MGRLMPSVERRQDKKRVSERCKEVLCDFSVHKNKDEKT